jgi:hypothetical protein
MPDKGLRLRRTELAWRDVNGTVLILDLRDSSYLELNRPASRLWHRLDEGGADSATLAKLLVEIYGIDMEQAEADVQAFLDMADQAGLLDH